MLSLAVRNTKKLVREQVRERNVRLGRFFTKKETAALMASMVTPVGREHVRVLDPGAGTGILSAALCEKLAQGGEVQTITLVCYETEPLYLPMLQNNLERIRRKCRHDYKVKILYTVREENYVLAPRVVDLLQEPETFDYIIMNPPRALCAADTPEQEAFAAYCSGETDLCYLFAAAAMQDLAPGGQAVMLLPTVFASGAYLGKLRRYMFSCAALARVHLFLRKTENARLLDEPRKDMLLLFEKKETPEFLRISTSYGQEPVHTVMRADYGSVVREDGSLLLLKSAEEAKIAEVISQLPQTLTSLGLRMRTGLTLESRYPTLLREAPEKGCVPLIHPRCIRTGRVFFPHTGGGKQYITRAVPSLLQKNKNMLFFKRVPAKSDKKALFCGIYLASSLPHYPEISTHNKLQYIDYADDREIDSHMLYGLFVVFNSSLYGKYYQVFSKSKQLNATEFATLPLPSAAALRMMGKQLDMCRVFSEKACDNILLAQMRSGKI